MKTYYRPDEKLRTIVNTSGEGYPHNDADGIKIFDNSHFATPQEAWDSLLRKVNLRVEVAGRDVEYAKEKLRDDEIKAGEAASAFAAVNQNYRDWQRENAKAE